MADVSDHWVPPTLEPTVTERELPGVKLLGQRCLVALALLALLTCTEMYVLSSQARLLKSEVLVSYSSGQQRYCWSRFNLALVQLLMHPQDDDAPHLHRMLGSLMNQFETTHARLVHGDPQLGFPAPPASVKVVLQQPPHELDRRAREYVAAMRAIADTPRDQLKVGHPVLAGFTDKGLDPKLLDGIEALINAWRFENEGRLAALQTTGYGCLVASVGVLVSMWFVVFAPMIRRVRHEALEMLGVNKALNRQTWQLHSEIEDRVAVEKALRHSEEQLRTITDSMPVLISYIDSELRYRFNNAAYGQRLGVSPEQITGRLVREVLGERLFEVVRPRFEQALSGQAVEYEASIPHPQGGERYIHALYVPRRDSDGSVLGFHTLVWDITDFKHTEEALRISRERFQLAMQLALDAVITIDEQGQITAWNAQAERIFGWTADEVLGQTMHDLILPPQYREAHMHGLRRFIETGESKLFGQRVELSALRRNGEEFPIELSLAPLRLEGGFEFSGFLRDITIRKQTESALQQLNENLELLVDQRSGYVQLLKDVAVLANEAESVELALRAALDMIARFMNWPVGAAYIPDDDEPGTFVPCVFWTVDQSEEFNLLREVTFHVHFDTGAGTIGRVIATGRPVWLTELSRDDSIVRAAECLELGLQTTLAFPIVVGHEVVAVLEFFSPAIVAPDDALLDVLAHLGTQLGRIVERRRLQAQLIDAVWEQQRELGQELHDTLGQELTGLAMMSNSLERKLDDRPTERELAAELTSYIRQSQQRVRTLSKGLFPVDVDAEGLRAALAEFVVAIGHRHEILCLFDGDEHVRVYDNKVATHLFRITQEAVHNAVKHARAENIVVRLRADPLGLAMYVYDDGRGMVPSNGSPGMGLRIMRYRAAAIGATLTIGPNEDGGTLMSCILPRKE